MPLPVPQLDDRTFDDLIDEARELIPRYAPAWTDHNSSNPGPTLIDLIAWIVDQQIWATGFLSDAHIESFAALLGVRPLRAKAATGLVWPDKDAIDPAGDTAGANIDAGARLVCIEQPEMSFRLTHKMHLSRARMKKLTLADGTRSRVFDKNTSFGNKPVTVAVDDGRVAPIVIRFDRPLVETIDGSESFPINLAFEIQGDVFDKSSDNYDPGRLVVDYRRGKRGFWQRVDVEHDETFALSQTGYVSIRIPPTGLAARKTKHELRISTRNRVHPLPPAIVDVALNAAPIVQHDVRDMRVIGAATTGNPDQEFDIELDHLAAGTDIRLQVSEGDVLADWPAVDDLAAESATSRVFQPLLRENKVRFGNGVNGMVPPVGAQIRHLPYSLTNGSDGNLAEELGWQFPSAPLASSAQRFGSNRRALVGGANRTSVDELRSRARQAATDRAALLTNEVLLDAVDALESLAVDSADVLVGTSPLAPGRTAPGNRSLLITPQRHRSTAPEATVPSRYVWAIRSALRDRRVLGEKLHFVATKRAIVRVRAELRVEDGFDPANVLEEARRCLDARLSDIRVDPDIEPWPPGRDVTVNEIRTLLAGVDGVITVSETALAEADDDWGNGPIVLPRDTIAVAGQHALKRAVQGRVAA